MSISVVAALRNTTKILKVLLSGFFMPVALRARCQRQAYSKVRAMKTRRVKTWKESPARETLTAALEPPSEVEERAPPTDCRTRERISQGMKIQ